MREKGFLLIWIYALMACEERFEPSIDRLEQENFVINGYINQSSTDPYVIEIEQTQKAGQPTPIFGACVEIVTEDGVRGEYREEEIGKYVYRDGLIVGQPGRAYHIEIKMQSGESFVSQPDVMPGSLVQDTMFWREERKVFTSELGTDITIPHVIVDLEAQIPTNDLNIWWVMEETFQFNEVDFPDAFGYVPPPCYITQQYGPSQINLFTSAGFAGQTFNIPAIIERDIDESFLTKHIFSTYQHSVSDQYFEYLESLETLVENTGNLFDSPPGVAVGNIDPVDGTDLRPYGFFGAVFTDTTRIVVYPSQMELPIPNKCRYIMFKAPIEYDPQCRDCEIIPRSSKVRPKYWTEL